MTLSRCLLLFLSLGAIELMAQPLLTSEVVASGPNGTTHRVYFQAGSGSEVLSVFASEDHPMEVTSTAAFHQVSGLSDVLSQNGLLLPGIDTDSWFSIGDGSIAGAANIGGAGWNAALQSFAGGGPFLCNDAFGGAIYLTPGTAQGTLQDSVLLLGQFTSTGTISLEWNIQWKPAGSSEAIESTGLMLTLLPDDAGCTDVNAVNFDAGASEDDGSCEYTTNGFNGLEWEQVGAVNGIPAYRVWARMDNPSEQVVSLYGTSGHPLLIQSSAAFQQSPGGGVLPLAFAASSDLVSEDSWVTIGTELNGGGIQTVGLTTAQFEAGGSLQSDAQYGGSWFVIPGNAPQAFPDADGRVLLAQLITEGLITFQASLAYENAEGELQELEGLTLQFPEGIAGCTDPVACNYVPSATLDAPCLFEDALSVCGGSCSADLDEDGVCDDQEVFGCTDETAINFDPLATEDDLGCLYAPDEIDTTGFIGLSYELEAEDLVMGTSTYRVYANFAAAGYEVISVFGNGEFPLSISAEAGFHQSPLGGATAAAIPGGTLYDALAADSWLTIGGDDAPSAAGLQSIGIDFSSFEAGGDLLVDASAGGGIFVIPGAQPSATAGTDGQVLLGQFTSAGQIMGLFNLQFRNPDGTVPEVRAVAITFPNVVTGCTDPMACNVDAFASEDDGSCAYPDGYPNPVLDCDGTCVSDADGDGICDPNEIAGCTAPTACNFDPAATDDDGSCETPEGVYGSADFDCDGQCLSDVDGDGTCDGLEVLGCTNPLACNFNPSATEEDGSCETSSCAGCTNPVACNYDATATIPDGSCILAVGACEVCMNGTAVVLDADGDGVCDGDEYLGCADPTACNFDPLVDAANADPALCSSPEDLHGSPFVDCDGVCLSDGDGDGVCDEDEVMGCTYANACNFNALATQEDGSCTFAEPLRDCEGGCLLDLNGDGICDDLDDFGCTYSEAYNYNPAATVDNGSCDFPQGVCQADLNQDGAVTVGDLLDFLVYFADPCDVYSAE